MFLSCFLLLIEGKDSIKKDSLFYLLLAWVFYIIFISFFIRVSGTSYFFGMVLCVFPLYCFSLLKNKKAIRVHIIAIGSSLFFFSCLSCYQYFTETGRVHYPLLNPNNLAAVLNVGLIGSIGLFLKDKKYLFLVPVFLIGVVATGSRGGLASAFICSLILLINKDTKYLIGLLIIGFISACFLPIESALDSLSDRIPIWLSILQLNPDFFGIGLGNFYKVYSSIRIENHTAGMWAHNDLLQLWIEAGYISLVLYFSIFLTILFKTTKNNTLPFCCLFVVLLHSQISFHFFLPSIGILLGLSLAHWRYSDEKYS